MDERTIASLDGRFPDTFMVLYSSYERGRGRTLDPEQVRILVDAFGEISESLNDAQNQIVLLTKEKAELEVQVERKRGIIRKHLSRLAQ